MFTRSPRLSRRQPIEAAARPLPKLDTTPPVTKTYFADIAATSLLECVDWPYLVGTIKYDRKPLLPNQKMDAPAPPCPRPLHKTRFSMRLHEASENRRIVTRVVRVEKRGLFRIASSDLAASQTAGLLCLSEGVRHVHRSRYSTSQTGPIGPACLSYRARLHGHERRLRACR